MAGVVNEEEQMDHDVYVLVDEEDIAISDVMELNEELLLPEQHQQPQQHQQQNLTSPLNTTIKSLANHSSASILAFHHNRNNSRQMDDSSSMGGWSEVSLPSSVVPTPNRHQKPQQQGGVDESSHSGSGRGRDTAAAGMDEQRHDLPLEKKNNHVNEEHPPENAFSWAEITKIQPTFQRGRGGADTTIEEKHDSEVTGNANNNTNNPIDDVAISGGCMQPSASTTKKPITVDYNLNKNNTSSPTKKPEVSTNAPPPLTQSQLDLINGSEASGNNESLENGKRAGKKRARAKHAQRRRAKKKLAPKA